MFIILKDIKLGTKVDHIEQFVLPAMKPGLFFKKGIIRSIKIILLIDANKRMIARHAIIRVSNIPANKIVNKLKGRSTKQENKIAEYVVRNWRNDRRIDTSSSLAFPDDRRKADRRKTGFRIVTVCEKPLADAKGVAVKHDPCATTCLACEWKTAKRHRQRP